MTLENPMKHHTAVPAAAAVCFMLGMTPGQSHHAVQAQFDVSKVVELNGTLEKIDWINPHTYMHFAVKENDEVKHYAIESVGILGLRRVGIDSKSAFKVGEPFTFTINPSRDGSPTGLLLTLVFPDGRRFELKTIDPTISQ
jgi:Family of unknown function (DUF6152)